MSVCEILFLQTSHNFGLILCNWVRFIGHLAHAHVFSSAHKALVETLEDSFMPKLYITGRCLAMWLQYFHIILKAHNDEQNTLKS